MRPGDRVSFVALWSSFLGQNGTVVAISPHLMVRLDGDTYPMRVHPKEVSILCAMVDPHTQLRSSSDASSSSWTPT